MMCFRRFIAGARNFPADVVGISPFLANVASYTVGLILGFVLTKKFVFRSGGHFLAASARYLIVFIVLFLVNLLALRLSLYEWSFMLPVPKLFRLKLNQNDVRFNEIVCVCGAKAHQRMIDIRRLAVLDGRCFKVI